MVPRRGYSKELCRHCGEEDLVAFIFKIAVFFWNSNPHGLTFPLLIVQAGSAKDSGLVKNTGKTAPENPFVLLEQISSGYSLKKY